MRKLFLPFTLAFMVLIATFGILQVARGQTSSVSGGETVLSRESDGENVREITAPAGLPVERYAPDQPQISFIDSPTAACVQPDHTKNECFINRYSLSVSANPKYMIVMTVELNEFGQMARYQGFFQTSMYAPYNMNPHGYKVACGKFGSGGDPDWGRVTHIKSGPAIPLA